MTFAKQIRVMAEKQKRNFRDVAAESLIDLSSSVIVKTPVLTGSLANSWRGGEGEAPKGVAPGGSNNGQSAQVEKAVRDSIGGVYYLVNNQPHARPVEYEGHSKKAPSGMLRVSINNYQNYLDRAINNIN